MRTREPEPLAGRSGPGRPFGTAEASEEPRTSGSARRRRTRRALVLLVLGVALASVLSLTVGSRLVGVEDVWAALSGVPEGIDQGAVAKRVPRTALALAAGAGLALSGAVMQGVTRNPLADPGILGVNTGASLAVAAGMVFFSLESFSALIWVALLGGSLTALLVYAMGSLGRGGTTPLRLALAGAATSAALSSLTAAVILPRSNLAEGFRSWQIGGVGGATWPALVQAAPYLAVGAVLCLLSGGALNTLALGDETAAGLGTRVGPTRAAAALGAVLLAAVCTAVCGPIGFVGLVVPHAVRMLTGSDYRWLLPLSGVGGAVLATTADVVGRVVTPPTEIEVGIITAVVGAPLFISIVRRQKVREL